MAIKTTSFTGPVVVGLNDKKGEIRLTNGKDVNEAKYLAIAAPDTITSDTTLTFPNGTGTAGQILSTDGSGTLSWVNDSAGNPDGSNGQVQFNDNGTFGAIPDGTLGQVLTSNGAGVAPSFQDAAGGGTDWQPVITTNTTAAAGQGFFVNTSGGAVTLTLPATPTQGGEVAFVDYAGTANTNNITISRNGENIQGSASDLIINTNRAANTLVYADATQGWLLKNV